MATNKKQESEERYGKGELLAHSESLFGCNPEIIHGALHGDSRQEYTVSEIRTKIEAFLQRKVTE